MLRHAGFRAATGLLASRCASIPFPATGTACCRTMQSRGSATETPSGPGQWGLEEVVRQHLAEARACPQAVNLADGVVARKRRSISQAITLCESSNPSHHQTVCGVTLLGSSPPSSIPCVRGRYRRPLSNPLSPPPPPPPPPTHPFLFLPCARLHERVRGKRGRDGDERDGQPVKGESAHLLSVTP
mmetsp:Transcript_5565/g.15530  ORF Transcript_5565/g.15530 Transcript_5565/m.15530 type:complete len:186 (+) Transcript_5565:286-843(+)